MKEILAELEKTIIRQVESGFSGKINILKKANDEIVGYLFIEKDEVTYFQLLSRKGSKAMHDFIYMCAKGFEPKFIVEPELANVDQDVKNKLNYRDFLKGLHEIFEKVGSILEFIPPSRLLVKVRKKVFSDETYLTMVEFMVAILVVKFREVGKIIIESEFSEVETLEAIISLRRKGCLRVLS